MSSHSSVDRAPAMCLGVIDLIPVRDSEFSQNFLCPTLVSFWSIDLSQTISVFLLSCYSESGGGWGSTRPMRSYSHFATKKVLGHSRAWWWDRPMQFTGTRLLVQYLGMSITSILLTMPTVTRIPTQILVYTTTTLFQAKYKTSTQSWLGLVTSHLMRWRCFISLTNIPTFSFSTQADQKESLF